MFKPLKVGRIAALVAGVLLVSGAAMAQTTSAEAATKLAVAAAPAASAGDTETVRKMFMERFPGVQVEAVKHTPFPNVFEVQIGMDLLYTDGQVNYVMQGSLIDAQTRRDLTAENLEKLSQVAFSSLPLEHAVKQVKGDGSRKIAIFEDPNCGFCKQLHKTLKDVDNTTIYTFLFPILSPDSEVKARNVWCAKDQAATWRAWMLDGKVPAEAKCDTPVESVKALGRKLMVRGTPAIIFADGSRVNGALPLAELKKKLDSVK
jgi:thiol:disulfide interchange protein DsbC